MNSKNLKRALTSLGLTLAFSTYSFSPALAIVASTAPSISNITVTNNKPGATDIISLKGTGLNTGDIVKVYSVPTGGAATTSAAITTTGQAITFSSADLVTSKDHTAGKIYISKTSAGKTESIRTAKDYVSDASTKLATTAIKPTNNAKGLDDTIAITTGVQSGDIINVYSNTTTTSAAISATVTGSSITLSKKDLMGKTAGKIYVTTTTANKTESARTEVSYTAEPVSTPLLAKSVTTTNNKSGKVDTIAIIAGVTSGDIINIYSDKTTTSAIATTTSTGSAVTLSGKDLMGSAAGKVYVTLTNTNKNESIRTEISYLSEISIAPKTTEVTSTNNQKGSTDIVTVSGIASGDVVNIYSDKTTTSAITTTSTGTSITFSQVDFMGTIAGKIYVTVTRGAKVESTRTEVIYKAEPVTTAPKSTAIVALNNDGSDDILRVTGLDAGYIVNVYDAKTGGNLLGTSTVATGKKSVNVNLTLPTITTTTGKGKVYVTVKSTTANESARTEVAYIGE